MMGGGGRPSVGIPTNPAEGDYLGGDLWSTQLPGALDIYSVDEAERLVTYVAVIVT